MIVGQEQGMVDPTEMAVEDLSAVARELDRAVHREIFGGEVERRPPGCAAASDLAVPLPTFTVERGETLPPYAERLSEAWRVVEYLKSDSEGLAGDVHRRFLEIIESHRPAVFEMPQRVAAEVICRAALRAVRQEATTVRDRCPECGERMEQVGYTERPGDGRAEEVFLCGRCGGEPTVVA